jgi:plastocyanin
MATRIATHPVASRRPLTPLTRWTIAALAGVLPLLAYLQFGLIGGMNPPILIIFGVPALLVIALIAATGWRWVPLLATLYWSVLIVLNIPFLQHDLAHPEFFGTFVFSVIVVGLALVGGVAGAVAAAQTYHGPTAREDGAGTPRWFSAGVVAVAGLVLGASLVATIPRGSTAGVSAEVLADLPVLAASGVRFEQAELRAQAGETVALRLENRDAAGHSFDIDELNVHVAIVPGEPALALFRPETAGTYTYYCGVPSHREAGMVGTLIVE